MILSKFGILFLMSTPLIIIIDKKRLFQLFVISIPFYTVQIAQIGRANVKCFQFIILLIGVKSIFAWAKGNTQRIIIKDSHKISFVVLGILAASLIMPLVYHGEIKVFGQTGGWRQMVYNPVPLKLSLNNFTQLLYFAFGLYMFYVVSAYAASVSTLINTLKNYIYAVNALGLNSLLYVIMYNLGYEKSIKSMYSFFWVKEISLARPIETQFGELLRGFTLAGEPGFTGIILLSALSILVGAWFFKKNIFKYPGINIIYLLVCIFFNGSTTAYMGVAVMLVFAFPLYVILKFKNVGLFVGNLWKINITVLSILSLASSIKISDMRFFAYTESYHIGKLFVYDSPRFIAAYHNLFNVFWESPILGAGYGSSLSLSLITYLLAGVGLLGVTAICFFVLFVLSKCYSVISVKRPFVSSMASGIILASLTYYTTISFAKAASSLVFASPWFLLGLADAISRFDKMDIIDR